MRFLSILALLATYFVFWPESDGQKPAAGQKDISRSGSNFLEACSSIDSEGNKSSVQISNDATCLGWVEGFEDGFTVRDELLGVPEKDRIVCMPRGVTTLQMAHIIKKYLADYPEKARRPTRYIASIALARAFPCKAGK
jgi:Ssp1 endopeptidase immunity protein Rap1a